MVESLKTCHSKGKEKTNKQQKTTLNTKKIRRHILLVIFSWLSERMLFCLKAIPLADQNCLDAVLYCINFTFLVSFNYFDLEKMKPLKTWQEITQLLFPFSSSLNINYAF